MDAPTKSWRRKRLTTRQPNFTPYIPATSSGVPTAAELFAKAAHMVPVPRVDPASFASRTELIAVIEEHIVQRGIPIVLENSLSYFGWDPAMATPQWVVDNCKTTPASIRDVVSTDDIPVTSLSEAVDNLWHGKPVPGAAEGSRLYGKDLPCPDAMAKHLADVLPPDLQYMGPNDFAHYLPENLRPVNLMLYGGGDGSFTAGHYDIAGSLGHNMMLYAEPGAYALWFLFAAKDKAVGEQIWASQGASLHLDNAFCPIDVLVAQGDGKVPIYVFEQRPGDFVILPSDSAHQVLNVGSRASPDTNTMESSGEQVSLPGGSNTGFNLKISWNRTTAESLALAYREVLPRYRAVLKPEIYRIKAQVYFATRLIAQKLHKWCKQQIHLKDSNGTSAESNESTPSDAELAFLIRSFSTLLPVCTDMMHEEIIDGDEGDKPDKDSDLVTAWPEYKDAPHTRTCDFCRCDIWNRGWTCSLCDADEEEEEDDEGSGSERKQEAEDRRHAMRQERPTDEEDTLLKGEKEGDVSSERDQATSSSGALPKEGGGKAHFDLCNDCYMLGRSCEHPKQMKLKGYLSYALQRRYLRRFYEIQNKALEELKRRAADSSHPDLAAIGDLPSLDQAVDETKSFSKPLVAKTVGTVAFERHKIYNDRVMKMCHVCKTARSDWIECPGCTTRFCSNCLWNRFGLKIGDARLQGGGFKCPRCNDECNCVACMRGRQATFASFPKVLEIITLASWFPHLDKIPHFAPHDLNYPRGPSYTSEPIVVEHPPAEWLANDTDHQPEGRTSLNAKAPSAVSRSRGEKKEAAGRIYRGGSSSASGSEISASYEAQKSRGRLRRSRRVVTTSSDSDSESDLQSSTEPTDVRLETRNRQRTRRDSVRQTRKRHVDASKRADKMESDMAKELKRANILVDFLRRCSTSENWADGLRLVQRLSVEWQDSGAIEAIVEKSSVDPRLNFIWTMRTYGLLFADGPTKDGVRSFKEFVEDFFAGYPDLDFSIAPTEAHEVSAQQSGSKRGRKALTSDSDNTSDAEDDIPSRDRSSGRRQAKRRASRASSSVDGPKDDRQARKLSETEQASAFNSFKPKIEAIEGNVSGLYVRASQYRIPGTKDGCFQWNKATGWINWTKVASGLGLSRDVDRIDPQEWQALRGYAPLQGRWVTPRAFKELVAERCPEHEKFMAPMLERVMLIRGKEKA